MTDIEAKLRHGMNAYAAETATQVVPPPFVPRAAGVQAPRHTSRRARVAAAVVGAMIVTGGVATATGTLPGPVSAVLREFRSWGFDVAEDQATLKAKASSEDMTYELWLAPVPGGGLCAYVRVVRSGTDLDHAGGSQCLHDQDWLPDEFVLMGVGEDVPSTRDRIGRHPLVAGRLPAGAAQLEVELSNGTLHRSTAEEDGFFVTILPLGLPDDTKVLFVRALSPGGQVVDERKVAHGSPVPDRMCDACSQEPPIEP